MRERWEDCEGEVGGCGRGGGTVRERWGDCGRGGGTVGEVGGL